MKQSLRGQLLNGNKAVGVWGLGFIGYSSMANFALAGVRCKGTDIDEYKVGCVNTGNVPTPNLEYWLGFNPKMLSTSKMMQATTDWAEILGRNIAVHLICIPTEKGDRPHLDILQDVITKLARYEKTRGSRPLIIIESTLTPNTTDTLVIPLLEKEGLQVGRDILVGVAPRRDWFVSADKNLKTLPRVVGGTTPETTDLMRSALSIVCDTVLPAKDHRHAELIKGIENAYRHVEITLANQLSAAYPDVDMRDVLRLVGTKWNIGCYSPDTSILTENGFVKVDKLKEGDKVWSINPDDKHLELANTEKMYSGFYDGDMIRGKKTRYGVDFLITPNHNLPILTYNSTQKVTFIKAEDALSYRKIRLISEVKWAGSSDFPCPPFVKTDSDKKKWLSLLGWYISEGHTYHKDGSSYTVTISQEAGENHNEIRELLVDLGFNPDHRTEKGKGRVRVTNKALFECLEREVGSGAYFKKIPRYVLNLSPDYLRYIFDALMKGDGHQQGRAYKYTTVSTRLKDDVAELALKLGYHVKVSNGAGKQKHIFRINICPIQNHELSPLRRRFKDNEFGPQLFREKFRGMVYCPALDKNHVLITERNGCVSINGNTYQPSFGTGGYCIPLSSQYILDGTRDPDSLSILQATVSTDSGLPARVATAVITGGAKRVGILGLAYKGDLKVHILSPTLRIVERLKQCIDTVKVNDPYYSAGEIERICGVGSFDFPHGLSEFDTVLIVTDHRLYTSVSRSKILSSLANCKKILDNTGIWQEMDFAGRGVEYRLAGRENWL